MKEPQTTAVDVPCAGCVACCKHERVALFEKHGDDVKSYDHEDVELLDGSVIHILKQKPDGSCTYLGEKGCTIHHRAPAVCRWFDCRRYFLSMPRNERRAIERIAKAKSEIFEAGRNRLSSLDTFEQAKAVNRRLSQEREALASGRLYRR